MKSSSEATEKNYETIKTDLEKRVVYLELYAFQPLENLTEICNNVRDAVAEAKLRLQELTMEGKIESFLSVIKERLSECKSAFNNIIARNDGEISYITEQFKVCESAPGAQEDLTFTSNLFTKIQNQFMTKHAEMAELFELLNREVIEFVKKASDLSGHTLSLIEEQEEDEDSDPN